MKSLIVAGLMLVGSLASASIVKNVSCYNPGSEDSSYTANFRIAGSEIGTTYTVRLWVPSGETQGTAYTGQCEPAVGIPESPVPFLTCTVMTSSDSGYGVDLWVNPNGNYSKATLYRLPTRGGPASNAVLVLPKCAVKP